MRHVLPHLLLAASSCTAVAHAHAQAAIDLGRHFGGMDATVVVLSGATGEIVRFNPERAARRFLPASTFKIPHTLIALETGVASGPTHILPWDSVSVPRQAWWPEAWSRPHSLSSALSNSVVWYYQETARRIGPERMRQALARLDYGNQDISGGIDNFWLSGGLGISALEQVRFLKQMYHGELPASPRSVAVLKEMLLLESTPEYRLSGKTGTASLTAERELGWLVGYVEQGADVHFFAINFEGDDVWEEWNARRRIRVTLAILRELGVLR